MKGTMRVLNRTGDSVLEWDTEVKNTDPQNGPLDSEYVKAEFDRLVGQGHLAFQVDEKGGQRKGEQIKKFDPEQHKEVILTPGFVGG